VAKVESLGYTRVDRSTYRASQPVAVLVAAQGGAADAGLQHAFFFADGRYIGTDARAPSAHIRVSSQTGSTVTLSYDLWRRDDPQCCPTAGSVTVRFRWAQGSLVPLDPIPSSAWNAPISRR
jgi:hypothetical protein